MIIEFQGEKIEIDDCVLTDRDKYSQFPLQTYEIWKSIIKPKDIVYDIGAYIGLLTICFEKIGANVYAFEGSPRNIDRFNKIKKKLNLKAKLHQIALSNKNEEIFTKFNDCIDRQHPIQKIKYVKFDDYIIKNNIPNPKFIKMDIEGMETVALKEMNYLIKSVRPFWQIECHTNIPFKYEGYPGYVSIEEGGFDFTEFEKCGYSIFDKNKKRIKIKNMKCFENYFFMPEKFL